VSDPLPKPIDVLPHRPPFLFVDEITALEVGKSARGVWHLTGDEWFFPGHFPGRPTLPGVLMAESVAQLGAVAVRPEDDEPDQSRSLGLERGQVPHAALIQASFVVDH